MSHPRERIIVRHVGSSTRVIDPEIESAVDDVHLRVPANAVRARGGSRVVVVPADQVCAFLGDGPAYLPAVVALL